jgi:hypothetical protein
MWHMPALFSISLALLCLVIGLRRLEVWRGTRFAERFRISLDRLTLSSTRRAAGLALHILEFIHKDVVLRTLHLGSYIALLSVRFVERRLARVTEFLRALGKKRRSRGTKPRLHGIDRENPTD